MTEIVGYTIKFDAQRLHTINVLPDFPHKLVKWKLKTQILFVNSIMQSRVKKQGFSFEFRNIMDRSDPDSIGMCYQSYTKVKVRVKFTLLCEIRLVLY